MSKALKRHMAGELTKHLESVDSFILFNFDKLKALEAYDLQKNLYEGSDGITILSVKNTIASIVFKKLYSESFEDALKGPTAIVYGGDNIVTVAKLLTEWNKKYKRIQIKGGFLSGKLLNAADVEELAKVPPREVMLSLLAGAFEAPLSQMATAFEGPFANIRNVVDNLAEKMAEKENSEI